MFDKSTRSKQVCQLLLSLIVGISLNRSFYFFLYILRLFKSLQCRSLQFIFSNSPYACVGTNIGQLNLTAGFILFSFQLSRSRVPVRFRVLVVK